MLYPFSGPIDAISYFGSDLLPSILRATVAASITISAMAVLSLFLTLVIAPIVPVFLGIRYHYRKRIAWEADAVLSDQTKFSSFLQEHLAALTQLQLLLQTEPQEETAHHLLTNAVSSQDRLCRSGVFFSAYSNLTIVTGIAVILACGSLMVFKDKLTTGTLVAFYSLLVQLFDPLSIAMEMYSRAQRTFSSIRQIQSVFEINADVKEHDRPRPVASDLPLDFAFRDVSFRYHRRTDLIRIPRLAILQGERVAVVGPNGAGKSTLGKLMARLYDVESGEIFIAGSDIRAVKLSSLRSSVCYLPPQPILFHRSVADNLRIGKPESSCDELEQVLHMVGLTKYLNSRSGSLQEHIEPNASNLSNGERQRIAIARALLQRPRILILDETTSSLDPTSEQAILRTIDRTLPDSTLIVVSNSVHSLAWM
jgi:ABC-type multidrug transport system fused ATPase/permease subunit